VDGGGARYFVFILEDGDDLRRIVAIHGPYQASSESR
jgi:hypothetical protein